MKLLLDTCAFIWLVDDSPELSKRFLTEYLDPANEVYLSAASAWEISVKYSSGKLKLPMSPERLVPQLRERSGIKTLDVDESAAVYVARLPWLHRDPFDRMLIAQAVVNNLIIMTPDHLIEQYGVRTLW